MAPFPRDATPILPRLVSHPPRLPPVAESVKLRIARLTPTGQRFSLSLQLYLRSSIEPQAHSQIERDRAGISHFEKRVTQSYLARS